MKYKLQKFVMKSNALTLKRVFAYSIYEICGSQKIFLSSFWLFYPRTFFKMVSLVVVLGAVHGIVLLPVLLSIMGPGACAAGKEKSPEDSTRSVDFLLMHSIVNHKRGHKTKASKLF